MSGAWDSTNEDIPEVLRERAGGLGRPQEQGQLCVCLPIGVSVYVHFCACGMWAWLCVWLFSCLWVGVCVSVGGFLTRARSSTCLPPCGDRPGQRDVPLHSAPAVGQGRGPGQRSSDYSRISPSPGSGHGSQPLTGHTHSYSNQTGNKLSLLADPGCVGPPGQGGQERSRWRGWRIKDVAGLGYPGAAPPSALPGFAEEAGCWLRTCLAKWLCAFVPLTGS